MQIITAPKVTLLARPLFLYPEHIAWRSDLTPMEGDPPEAWEVEDLRAPEVLAEFAGRLSYLSFGKGELDGHRTVQGRTQNEAYLEHILSEGHGNVAEHAVFSLLVEGVSRSLSHELIRHRAGMSYTQVSQRYVDESSVAFVLPPEIPAQGPAYRVWVHACTQSLSCYRALLSEVGSVVGEGGTGAKKRARQAARAVLPNCTETKLVVTGNVRALRGVIEQRAAPGADAEIRRLAVTLYRLLREEAPNLFADYKEVPLEGTFPGDVALTTPYPKV